MSEQEAVAGASAALARGDLLAAYDLAQRRADAESPTLDYLKVLILARLGDTDRALQLYDVYGLGQREDVDALALKARLLKDKGFGAGEPSVPILLEACKLYTSVYRRTRDAYPAINAATLAWIAGRKALAQLLARVTVRRTQAEIDPGYYGWATLAEALLVLGDMAGAATALGAAMAAPDADAGKRSTTVLQLQRLARSLGGGAQVEALLAQIRPPRVATYCGHIFTGGVDLERRLGASIRAAIETEQVGFAYGSLAAGADIVIAEQLLAHGVELHVVLPVTEPDFIKQSVTPAGEGWLARYTACRKAAASLTLASNMSHVGGQGQFAYASKVAMGMARLRARHLNGDAVQLAIAEEAAGSGTVTRSDIRSWRETGGRSVVIETEPLERPPRPQAPAEPEAIRHTHGLMFTDFPGYARLEERVLPIFWREVMGRAAQTLRAHGDNILHSNTWGDALYVVFADVLSGTKAALELCECFKEVDAGALGLRGGATMRIALHYGPTYSGLDPVTGRTTYYGSEVARAARIEPVTPPGSVYVTEPFAAILEMEPGHSFVCNYVGKVELPKGYGIYPLYHLKAA
ncbi:adenylate/guanylate cyclase domain-containing protein [Phenylobacterium sp.]|uniref:adenylate/guanylate cyclase domain-containing protein n=1 Tax=Phenylobacterium sp. TaxID=1871053 RepID=UPI0025E4FA9D|nr:adenylate/guanylate cyclase domain-containing protein [Phenylobacterium sp.]